MSDYDDSDDVGDGGCERDGDGDGDEVFRPVGFHLLLLLKPPGQVSCLPVRQSLPMIILMAVLLRMILMMMILMMMMLMMMLVMMYEVEAGYVQLISPVPVFEHLIWVHIPAWVQQRRLCQGRRRSLRQSRTLQGPPRSKALWRLHCPPAQAGPLQN